MFDPMGLTSWNLWESGDQATIGFLRHAEIKHGRGALPAHALIRRALSCCCGQRFVMVVAAADVCGHAPV